MNIDRTSIPSVLEIRRPALTEFAQWIADWRGDPYDAYRGVFARAWTDFDWYVASCERMLTRGAPPPITVPLDARWAFIGDVLVGERTFYEPMADDNSIGS